MTRATDPDCRADLAAARALAAARLRTMRDQAARIRQLAADVAALRAALDRACAGELAGGTYGRAQTYLAVPPDARRGRAT